MFYPCFRMEVFRKPAKSLAGTCETGYVIRLCGEEITSPPPQHFPN